MSRCVSLGACAMPGLPLLPDHEDAIELDDRLAPLVEPARPKRDEAEPGTTSGFPDLRDFCLRIDRIPVEHGAREADVLHADLEPISTRHVDEHARRDRDGQEAVHDPAPAERLSRKVAPRVVLVEVNLVRIPGQEGEPHVVRLRNGPPDLAPDLRPDPEVLEKRPVLVHGDPAEGGVRSVMNVAGEGRRPQKVARAVTAAARRRSPNARSYQGKQPSTAITSCPSTPS